MGELLPHQEWQVRLGVVVYYFASLVSDAVHSRIDGNLSPQRVRACIQRGRDHLWVRDILIVCEQHYRGDEPHQKHQREGRGAGLHDQALLQREQHPPRPRVARLALCQAEAGLGQAPPRGGAADPAAVARAPARRAQAGGLHAAPPLAPALASLLALHPRSRAQVVPQGSNRGQPEIRQGPEARRRQHHQDDIRPYGQPRVSPLCDGGRRRGVPANGRPWKLGLRSSALGRPRKHRGPLRRSPRRRGPGLARRGVIQEHRL
mmetsp:Transcript_63416/g.127129  ORF Transcript_63416/g.127129 Transcript_63416/m.127129 type:complete len:262 (+) Transcript_63416:587-1372(+)